MTAAPGPDPVVDDLAVLHQQLDAHFRVLREQRDDVGKSAPIFALEHGLSESELALLKTAVRSSVRPYFPPASWLPFVVYAAEAGYEYSGEEYWPTFESLTPGWSEYGDRDYVRRQFREFKERYGGAEPTGRWANLSGNPQPNCR